MEQVMALFADYTFQVVAVGSGLLGVLSGALGSFAVLRKQSLLGDGISHGALPGVVLAFFLIGSKNTEVLLLGALVTGLLSAWCIHGIVRHTTLAFETALALILSVFFGLGLVLLTLAQKLPNANQAGLDRFIYGQASALLLRDVYIIAGCGGVILLLLWLFWKEFALVTFDPIYAQVLGRQPHLLGGLLTLLLVLTSTIGLQTVGVILMSAMLITPAVAARQWVNSLKAMVGLSAVFGGLSGVLGTAISSWVPGLATGPVIVICASSIAVVSLLFAPKRGMIATVYHRHQSKRRVL